MSPAWLAGRTHRPRAWRLSTAGPDGRPPQPGPGRSVPLGRLVDPRGPHPEALSAWAGLWSTVLVGYSRRGAWSISVARARTMSPAVLDGRTHRPRAWRLSTAGPDGRPPQLGPVRSVPLGRLVDPRDPSPEAESRSAGWWSPAPGGRVPPGRMVDPRAGARRLSPAVQAGRPPRPAPGSSVPTGRLVEHRARRLSPDGAPGRSRWPALGR